MKKFGTTFAILSAAVLAWACAADDDPFSSSTSSGGGDSSSTSSTATTVEIDDTDDSEDTVDSVNFDRTITITFSTGGSATVSGDENGVVSVSGNGVTVHNEDTGEKVIYRLKGTTTDGYFKVYSSKKQKFILDGVSITNKSGAAINNQGKKSAYVVIEGTNYLADGSSYTDTPSDEDEKAALFSEGQLIFSGSGSLTVNSVGKSGIISDDYLRFQGGQTVKVTSSAGHGVRGKEAVFVEDGILDIEVSAAMKKGMSSDSLVRFDGGATTIKVTGGTAYDDDDNEYKGSAGVKADQIFKMNDGTLTITNSGQGGKGISGDGAGFFTGGAVNVSVTGSNYGSSNGSGQGGGGGFGTHSSNSSSDNSKSAKAIKFDGNVAITGGTIIAIAKNHEAIESGLEMDITGGVIYANASDDAINAGGVLTISGGSVCAYSTGNDGLDGNQNVYLEGGFIYAIGTSSPEVGVDANTEGGYKLYVNGGTIIAIGGLESGFSGSQSCYSASWSANQWYAITDGDDTWAFKTPSKGGNTMVISGEDSVSLSSGISVSGGTEIFEGMAVTGGTVSGGSTVSLSSYSGGGGGGMGGGGGGGGRW